MLLLLAVALLAGCGDARKVDAPEDLAPVFKRKAAMFDTTKSQHGAYQETMGGTEKEEEEEGEEITRKVVYTGQMQIEVEDYPASLKELMKLIKDAKGVLARSDETGRSGYRRQATLVARIPVKAVEDFRAQVAKLGEVQQNKLDSRDVTGRFYDAKGELESLKKELADFEELRKQQAAKGADLTTVTQQVHRVRREIDTLKGRLARITNLVELTTFTVELVERTPYTPREAPPLGTRTVRAFSDSLSSMGTVLLWLVLAVVAVAPWVVGLTVVAVPVVFMLRAARGQQPPPQAPPASEQRPPAVKPPPEGRDESPPTIV
jgi:hypothetical protein